MTILPPLLAIILCAGFLRALCRVLLSERAYRKRCEHRLARVHEDVCWFLYRELESEHARKLHLARTSPGAKFLARDTLRRVQ
jgi:hypothetical protein